MSTRAASRPAIPPPTPTACPPPPLPALLALGHAYRTGALADPHLSAVMFGSPVPGFEPAPQDYAHAEATFVPLLDTVRRAIAAGLLRDADPDLVATALWANVH